MSESASHKPGPDGFRLRGKEMSRIDGFSDVVFGFALTLLVVSLEVPKSYAELHELMRGFLPFAINFTLLVTVWYAHFQFFRRYGLHDTRTITLNAMLLFVVLFYVYPLKFLFGMLVGEVAGTGHSGVSITQPQVRELLIIYGLGFAAIYLLFAAMYANALRQKEDLELNPLERKLTKIYLTDHLIMGSIGLLSCMAAWLLPERLVGLAGLVYFLIGITKTIWGAWAGRISRQAPAV
jgi:uncharacterized membrane protein